jgi:hypothetical protein
MIRALADVTTEWRVPPGIERLNKPQERHRTPMQWYRTQEVAGSSPASSMQRAPENVRGI